MEYQGSESPEKTRIVVTGMGMVSPYGMGVTPFLEATRRGESCARCLLVY